jgi:uncharacterized protein GlcG (DUF336 family)
LDVLGIWQQFVICTAIFSLTSRVLHYHHAFFHLRKKENFMMARFSVSWRRLILCIPVALVVLLLSASVGKAQTTAFPQEVYLPLDLALQGASAALTKCQTDGFAVTVAVVDRAGLPKVHLRDDGAGLYTIFSSLRKAYTAMSLGRTTLAMEELRRNDPASEGLGTEDPQLLFLGGGVPIISNDEVIGGIGVTGAGDGALNEACAQAGADAILAATGGAASEGSTDNAAAEATAEPTEEATEEATEEPAEEATPEPAVEATATP